MMAAGLQAIKLAVEHVREPGERVPVAGVVRSEGPGDSLAGQPPIDMRVFTDVFVVVEVDELVAGRLAKDGGHGQHQQAADGQQAPGPAGPRRAAGGRAIEGRSVLVGAWRHRLLLPGGETSSRPLGRVHARRTGGRAVSHRY